MAQVLFDCTLRHTTGSIRRGMITTPKKHAVLPGPYNGVAVFFELETQLCECGLADGHKADQQCIAVPVHLATLRVIYEALENQLGLRLAMQLGRAMLRNKSRCILDGKVPTAADQAWIGEKGELDGQALSRTFGNAWGISMGGSEGGL